MTKPDIEMKLLRAFVGVATERSFTAGARVVGCSQSAISTRVRVLEETIGDRLFDRTRMNVRLTPAGEKFYPEARALLDLHDRLIRAAWSRAVGGIVRIGATEGFGASVLAPLLDRIRERYAAIELQIVCGDDSELRQFVETGNVDLALILLAKETDAAMVLDRPRLRWVGAPDYAFGQGGPIDFAGYPEGCPVRTSALATLEKHGIAYCLAATSWSDRLLDRVVRSGQAITAMPENLVPEDLRVLFQPSRLPRLDTIAVQILEQPDLDNEAARVVVHEIKDGYRGQ